MAYERKNLVLRKFGWKRICRNTQCFGWVLDSAYQNEETTIKTTYTGKFINDKIEIKENNQKSTKVRIHLSFYRDSSSYSNLNEIKLLEAIYNIFFFFRKILAFFLSIICVVAAIIFLLGHAYSLIYSPFGRVLWLCIFIWLSLIIAENILAKIAFGKLKSK